MKNRVLSILSHTIPFSPELAGKLNSRDASLLMMKMEQWFESYPGGFYKFTEPCGNKLYRQGDSWCEQLGFKNYEVRDAFDLIGTTYKSRTAYERESNPFKGKYYCRYRDNNTGETWYFRNHAAVDLFLSEFVKASSPNPEYRQPIVETQETPEEIRNTENRNCAISTIGTPQLRKTSLHNINNENYIGEKDILENQNIQKGNEEDQEKPKKPTRRASSITEDWEISEKLKQSILLKICSEISDEEFAIRRDVFVDFWLGKKGTKDGRKTDWDATFRNHIRSYVLNARHKTRFGKEKTNAERLKEQNREYQKRLSNTPGVSPF